MRQRSQREGVLIDVGRFVQQRGDKFSATNVVHQVAEILAAAGIVAHILNQAAAVSVGMCLAQIFGGRVGKPRQQHGLNLVLPRQIDDLLMGQDGIASGRL